MSMRLRQRLKVLALAAAAATSLLVLTPALADNTVTLTIVPKGTLNAGIVDATLLPIESADEPQRDSGVLHLIVSDPRGTSAGWSVSIASSAFDYQGDPTPDHDIPNTGFRIHTASAPEVIAGQPRTEGGPNYDPLVGASLESPRTVIWADPGAGSGDYAQTIAVVLDIPAGSPAGTYLATLTVAFASAP